MQNLDHDLSLETSVDCEERRAKPANAKHPLKFEPAIEYEPNKAIWLLRAVGKDRRSFEERALLRSKPKEPQDLLADQRRLAFKEFLGLFRTFVHESFEEFFDPFELPATHSLSSLADNFAKEPCLCKFPVPIHRRHGKIENGGGLLCR